MLIKLIMIIVAVVVVIVVVVVAAAVVVVWPSVVACTCNPATLEAEFWNGVGLIPVGDNSPSISGWIV